MTGSYEKGPLREGAGGDGSMGLAQTSVGAEGPGAVGDGLRMLPQDGFERLFPDTRFPDARRRLFGKGDLAAICYSNPLQRLCHDATAGDARAPRLYANPAEELNDELDLGVAHALGRRDGAMKRDGILGRTSAEPASSLVPPPGERGRG